MPMSARKISSSGRSGSVTLRGGSSFPAPKVSPRDYDGHACRLKEHGLEIDLPAFRGSRFACWSDHRHFGASDGAERGDSDPWQQIAEFAAPISFLVAAEVDAVRSASWLPC